MTSTESPHSLTVKAINPAGFDCLFTVRADDPKEFFEKVNGLLTWLPKAGFTPTAQAARRSAPATGATAPAGAVPVCPYHGAMKQSTKHPGFYCSYKMGDGSYCKTRADATGRIITPQSNQPMPQAAAVTYAANGTAPAPMFDDMPPPQWDNNYYGSDN